MFLAAQGGGGVCVWEGGEGTCFSNFKAGSSPFVATDAAP